MTSIRQWRSLLERCGLQVEGLSPQNSPPVDSALHAVNGIEVEPVTTVPLSSPVAADELDQKWHQHASATPVYRQDGEFLILPPVSGGSKVGWARVKDPVGSHLPSRIAEATGAPEFIAVSVDGRHLCAVSVEDDDYWVVRHEFR